ncbi:MAG: alanine--tRNA ligase [Gemmatimonadales bacterium]|nr:MAG: alanine--tRNA ligase [Gemmatimonadales bacterium]
MKANEIRSRFIRFFEQKDHLHLPSGSLVPEGDPTLLFANAGMVQFKDVFTGQRERPAARAVTSQKCLRVSGKHNDLEEVGRTARHHTFFEMLGNFSFGDYFKRDAIGYAWEFMTEDLGMDPDRLWATVHHTDDEAAALWLESTDLPASRIFRLGDKDNFWQMGETGPCGPCSEIHYDMRPSGSPQDLSPEQFAVLGEADQFMEIWNLVFMQFQRTETGDVPLPAPSIDTGAGLERIAAILQDTGTNYHTDLFLPIISAAESVLGRAYSQAPEDWDEGLPIRVLADHARAVAFMLADGVFPSTEGRGYVLRRILRRAGRYAWLLGRREPTLESLVGVVVDEMSETYPELTARREHLVQSTRSEEERFLATIDAGMNRFDEVAPAEGSGTIPGDEAFKLYDTFGFPLDLTELMAAERGYAVDLAGFSSALETQRERSRRGSVMPGTAGQDAAGSVALDTLDLARALSSAGDQTFVGYDVLVVETPVLAYEREGATGVFILERNPFYHEAGGQISDSGRLVGDDWEADVRGITRNERDQVVVVAVVTTGELPQAVSVVRAAVSEDVRHDTERNHTATHLLHAALRETLGDHVHQAGSLVAPDRLRFDFSHSGVVAADELLEIEQRVNEAILANGAVEISHTKYREALNAGAMALFGEKYGDVVRVVAVPGVSLELCGGCHVRTTGEIGQLRIISETGVAAGVRRVEAVTGLRAWELARESEAALDDIARTLRVTTRDVPRRLISLQEEIEFLRAAVAEQRGVDSAGEADRLVAEAGEMPGGGQLICTSVGLAGGTDLSEFGDVLRARLDSGAAILHVTLDGSKDAFLAVVTDDWIARGLKAGDLVRAASKATGSGGGGGPHLAQGGIGDTAKVEAALDEAGQHARGIAVRATS